MNCPVHRALLLGFLLSLLALGGARVSGARPSQSATVVAHDARTLDPRIVRIIDAVSTDRLRTLVEKLQSFDTRNTLSATASPVRGIGAARQWIHDEMRRSSARLQVSFDTYRVAKQGRIVREAELRNVIAVLPGRSARRIYVSGHYDSLAREPGKQASAGQAQAGPSTADVPFDWNAVDHFAPGANDDGSGTALTMELARVFGESGADFDATLAFVTFAGEEQGLIGAHLHAQRAREQALAIDAVFNNDIVGNVTAGNGITDASSVRVFSEGPEDSASRQLARYIRRVAARYMPSHSVRLIARHDRFGRGGDHSAFNQRGYAGVRFTEARENYARQHTVADTADGVSFPYLAANARVNAAAVAALAFAPPAPSVVNSKDSRPMLTRQSSGYDANLKWTPSPGAIAYRIVWRAAWTPDWEHEMIVGNATEAVLRDVSIDDFVFGVAAIGTDGHESVVSAYVNPPRADSDVKTVP